MLTKNETYFSLVTAFKTNRKYQIYRRIVQIILPIPLFFRSFAKVFDHDC